MSYFIYGTAFANVEYYFFIFFAPTVTAFGFYTHFASLKSPK